MTTETPTPISEPVTLSSAGETATLGAGCYWCIEAALRQVDGVISVTSGFMGGQVENPTYEQVCQGNTGHAEVVQVVFRPEKLSYRELLDWFWKLHDPTTLNRQGNDVGTQYRSVIFYHHESQRTEALASMSAASKDFSKPIVTEISPAGTFYPAPAEHQDYHSRNRSKNPYCTYVISPKLRKLGLAP
jgi:peptide-methionine (S)-S-oxide reductase